MNLTVSNYPQPTPVLSINNNRNRVLDLFKILAALFVVMIHYNNVGGLWGDYYTYFINGLARFAVPTFFMITGYFLPTLIFSHKFQRYQKKIFKLTILTTIIYYLYYSAWSYIDETTLSFTKNNIVFWLVFNECPIAAHLWYFYALLYSLFLINLTLKITTKYGIFKRRYLKFALRLTSSILLASVIYAEYTGFFFTRNFILGIACILIGIDLRTCGLSLRNSSLWLFIAILANIVELLILSQIVGVASRQNVYVTSIILAMAIVAYSVSHQKDLKCKLLSGGGEYATWIFILHVMVGDFFLRIYSPYNRLYCVIFPFLVYTVSLLLSIFIMKTRKIYGAKIMA